MSIDLTTHFVNSPAAVSHTLICVYAYIDVCVIIIFYHRCSIVVYKKGKFKVVIVTYFTDFFHDDSVSSMLTLSLLVNVLLTADHIGNRVWGFSLLFLRH